MYGLKHLAAQKIGYVENRMSTVATLAIDEEYTSAAVEVTDFLVVCVSLKSDVDGTLRVEFSPDGTNWDFVDTMPFKANTGNGANHAVMVSAKWARIVYVNGKTEQAFFRLQTLLQRARSESTIARSAITFATAVAADEEPAFTTAHVFGHNEDLGTTIEDIWCPGGVYVWPTAGATLEAISDDADDTAAGSGARTLLLEGLDDNYEEITAVLAMNGTSATLPTSLNFRRLNRACVATSGTYHEGAQGNITIRISGAGAIQGRISHTSADGAPWRYGQTQTARYTVPAGKTALLTKILVANEGNKQADCVLFKNVNSDTILAPFSAPVLVKTFDGFNEDRLIDFEVPLVIPEKTDLWAQGRLTSGVNGKLTVDFELLIFNGVI